MYYTAEELTEVAVDLVRSLRLNWLTISGGNPCLWNLTELVDGCHKAGIKVMVETQGTIYRPWVAKCDSITISPKGPGMLGENQTQPVETVEAFLGRLRHHHHHHYNTSIKVVVFDEADIKYARQIRMFFPRYPLLISQGNALLDVKDSNKYLREQRRKFTEELLPMIYATPELVGVRVLPQLHTWLWGNEKGR